MVEQNHTTRRRVIKSSGAALTAVAGLSLVGSASATEWSNIHIEGNGDYSFYIVGNFEEYKTDDFEGTIYIDSGNSIYVSDSINEDGSWIFEDNQEDIAVPQEISDTDIQPAHGGAIDSGVDIEVTSGVTDLSEFGY